MKNEYYLREDGNRIFMCCGKANCPSAIINEENFVEISDDYGNTVKMKIEEAELLDGAIKKLTTSSSKTNAQ